MNETEEIGEKLAICTWVMWICILNWVYLNNSSKSRCAVGKICCGNSLIRYWANFCSWSRCKRVKDSETGALKQTSCGYKQIQEREREEKINFEVSQSSEGINRFNKIWFCEMAYTMNTMQTHSNHMRAPICSWWACTIAWWDSPSIKRNRHIELSSWLCTDHSGRQVKSCSTTWNY